MVKNKIKFYVYFRPGPAYINRHPAFGFSIPMEIGYTGTSRGMGRKAKATLEAWLRKIFPVEQYPGEYPKIARHGDCVGGDAEFHAIIRELFPKTQIHCHPGFPIGHPARAGCEGDVIHDVEPPLTRNHTIVNAVPLIFAAPPTRYEVVRSGTWSTIRYAKTANRNMIYLWPD